MELFAGLSVCALILVALFTAIKTIGLWRRTRGLPELLLGGMLISATVLGYPLAIASMQVTGATMWPVLVASQLSISLGYVCLLLFTLNVFRADALWAKALVLLTIGGLVAISVVYIGQVAGGLSPGSGPVTGASIFTSIPISIAYVWTTVESLVTWRRLKLQVRLGLASPVVANRVLLWGLMCLAAVAAVILSNGVMLIGGTLLGPRMVLACSVLGLLHAGCLFFAFHPPTWYKAWIERAPAAASA